MGQPVKLGIVGCGAISRQYLDTLPQLPQVELTAVADLDRARADAVAAGAGEGVRACDVEELITAADLELVINLTVPAAHADVSLAALRAGKDVYTEKPLTAALAEGRNLVEAAAETGRRLGCAPDTVLGTGLQTARRAVDDGVIGRPVAATAVMVTAGHERWHPNPDFYYQPGGGPLLDMGPYYLSALITLLGPVTAVSGMGSRSRDHRVIGSGDRAGEQIPVDVDTHVTGLLRHAGGAVSTLVMSFDAAATRSAPIEVHGETGSLSVPDPNRFDGEVGLRRAGETDWTVLPVGAGYRDAGRGFGVADLVATPDGRTPRADGTLGLHVLEVMHGILAAGTEGREIQIESSVQRPDPVPLSDLRAG